MSYSPAKRNRGEMEGQIEPLCIVCRHFSPKPIGGEITILSLQNGVTRLFKNDPMEYDFGAVVLLVDVQKGV
jgi:hypothetical protein